ncbi:MAG TPA: bifunctional YncE family protein/alkaline phosphatase family protein, partial [Chloroflexota bacterium]
MSSPRSRLVVTLAAMLALVGYVVGPASTGIAGAHHNFTPSQYLRDLASAQFAAEAAHIGVLRGVNTRVLSRRFTADARLRLDAQTGQSTPSGTVNVNNWALTPAGTQSDLGDLPVKAVLAPNGQTMLVVNSGAGIQSLQVINPADGSTLQTLTYDPPTSVFVGAVYSPDGKHAYVSGGGQNVVHTFAVASDGTLIASGDISEAPTVAPLNAFSSSSYPTGLSVSADGKTLYIANSNANNVAVIDTASQKITTTISVGNTPYGTLVARSSGNILVSNWGDGTLSVINPLTNTVTNTIKVGDHPTEMVQGPSGLVYVSDSNSDAVSIVDPGAQTEISHTSVVGNVSLPLGASPEGLAASPDGRFLYIANSGQNAVAEFDLSFDGRSAFFEGWIPTAWYPTDVVVSPDSRSIFVTNGFGMGEHANNGSLDPNPTRPTPSGVPHIQQPAYCSCSIDQFTATMDTGTLSTVAAPTLGQLRNDTMQVIQNDRLFDASRLDRSQGNPVPLPGGTSPIKHVIYIVKENRTYDQILGDESAGNGDASLALFPKSVTPNLHALAERFGILDNFYADAQVSADGHNWTLSANANDYVEKLWPQDYSSPARNFGYPFESGSSLPLSPGGYLWDAAASADITFRDYGLYANFANTSAAKLQPDSQSCDGPITHTYIGTTIPAGQVLCFPPTTVNAASTPNLVGHIDPQFQNYDMNYPDVERVAEWKREFNRFVGGNNLPALEIMRLSSDHTRGTASNTWTPQRFASDNDAAVG